MKLRSRVLRVVLGAAMTLSLAAGVAEARAADAPADPQGQAGSTLERVRSLYVAAAYEEALAAMPAEATGTVRRDLEQYRALCLLALGRDAEAVSAIERLVNADPTYLPDRGDTSPRMRSLFADVRSKVVPDLARATYASAKQAFAAKQVGAAESGFRRTIELIDSLPDADKDALDDLRILVAGFLDLIAASPAAAPPPLPALDSPPPSADASADYVPPVAVREELPGWSPPDVLARRTEYIGLLRVLIGSDGRVTNAAMVKGSHPTYDAAAVRAAKTWIYRPATRGGRPVTAQKDIQVRLMPR